MLAIKTIGNIVECGLSENQSCIHFPCDFESSHKSFFSLGTVFQNVDNLRGDCVRNIWK